ncbi:MAG: ABC transporter substrate-binding protein [Alkalibacterium sp.]|nr:ABC transporter substrate-binding protein [Alkalibacterium sp.]
MKMSWMSGLVRSRISKQSQSSIGFDHRIKFRHEAIQAELESIAPTVFFDPYPTDETVSQYDEMESTFKEIAKAVGKSNEAEDVLAELDATYEEAMTRIDDADLETNDVILTKHSVQIRRPKFAYLRKMRLLQSFLKNWTE